MCCKKDTTVLIGIIICRPSTVHGFASCVGSYMKCFVLVLTFISQLNQDTFYKTASFWGFETKAQQNKIGTFKLNLYEEGALSFFGFSSSTPKYTPRKFLFRRTKTYAFFEFLKGKVK